MYKVQIKVEEAVPNDFGRGIIRVDPTTLLSMQLSPGGIVEIEGKRKTAAKAWRAERQDWGKKIIRIDSYIQHNAGVEVGEKVTIKKAEFEAATYLVLTPRKDLKIRYSNEIEEIIKKLIVKYPFVVGDVVPINNYKESLSSRREVLPFIVVDAEPHGSILRVEKTTKVQLQPIMTTTNILLVKNFTEHVTETQSIYENDVAFSFAGEDRPIVKPIAEELIQQSISVFYDEFEKEKLWGKRLSDYFKNRYGNRTRFVVIFISKHYPNKDWTDFEFTIAREEAKNRNQEFIFSTSLILNRPPNYASR